jgi:hypothetical protein
MELVLGRNIGRVEDYGVRTSKKGDPLIVIVFNVQGERIYWNGNFTNDMGRKISLETLAECGLKDIKSLTNGTFAEGKKSGCLDTDKDIIVGVDLTTGENGKQFYAIKYVGGGDGVKDAVDKAKAASLFTGMGLEIDFEKYKPKAQIPF